MNLLPYRKITVTTNLTKQEVLEKINANTGRAELLSQSYGTLFSGTVNSESFKIRRNINYRNSFLPIVTGRFLPHGNRTILQLTFKPVEFVIAFMIVWLGGVSLASISMIFLLITCPETFSAPMLIPFAMLVFGIALFGGGFTAEYPKSKDTLLNLINAEEID